jgi:hypothetical protein
VTKLSLVDDREVSRYLVRQLLPRGIYDLTEAAAAEIISKSDLSTPILITAIRGARARASETAN